MKSYVIISKVLSFALDKIVNFRINIRKKIKEILLQIKRKGSQHLTVMFIPHSEEKILRLHISYFTIFFIFSLIVIITSFSLISLLSHTTTQQEVSNLLEKSKYWAKKDTLIKEEIENITKSLDNLKPEIEKLYSVASSLKEKNLDLWAKGGIKESESIDEGSLSLPADIYDLKQINRDLELTQKYIEHIKNFIEERSKFFSKIPSIWPLKVGGYVTSDYGWRRHPFYRRRMEFHRGIDIASWPSAPVVATAEGVVVFAGWQEGYGLAVIVRHEYGFETYYAHLSKIATYAGKKVRRGETIGYLGKTGITTGYHLHYEVRIGLQFVNPWPYIVNIKH